jgi:hypothetical protein
MKIELSLAFAYKLCVLLFAAGMIGAVLTPRHSGMRADEDRQPPAPPSTNVAPGSANALAMSPESGPMTRVLMDGIYFDVVRANGQGEQLQIELSIYNTGPDRNITPGRAKGILEPPLFATVFDEQGGKWYADQVQIANVSSTAGYLPESKLISGVPTSMVLTFARMPAIAGVLQIRTIPRLEVPVIVTIDDPQQGTSQGSAVVLVFRQIPVERR